MAKMASQIDEAQLAVWRQEQQDIAQKTIIVPDNLMERPLKAMKGSHDESDTFLNEKNISSLKFDSVEMTSGESKKMLFGGVDISFAVPGSDAEKANKACAVYVVTEASGEVVYEDYCIFTLDVPYVPSFLAFREITPYVQLIEKQKKEKPHLTPGVILVDGNGILHPRRAGIACFVGVRTGIPSIGVAKTFYDIEGYIGEGVDTCLKERVAQFVQKSGVGDSDCHDRVIYDSNVLDIIDYNSMKKRSRAIKVFSERIFPQLSRECRGYAAILIGRKSGDVLGAALVGHGGVMDTTKRISGSTRPIYVSVGHNISLQEAVRYIALLSKCRIPEPVRYADLRGRHIMKSL